MYFGILGVDGNADLDTDWVGVTIEKLVGLTGNFEKSIPLEKKS